MSSLFQKTSSHWVKYSEYEYKQGGDGTLYLSPKAKAKPTVYDPLKDSDAMVVDALNVGMLAMNRVGDSKLKAAVLEFVSKYGLLGFMTALPTTPQFMDYESVYLPKNHFLREETMPTKDYVDLFFPFSKPDFQKDERTAQWNVNDRDMLALAMTFGDSPTAMNMSFQRDYAERFDWLVKQFKDLAFSLCASVYFYTETDELERDLHRQAMMAFGGIAPTYHIALYDDKPTIVWDFHSLLSGIQMMFSFLLTDEARPLRACKRCMNAFITTHPRTEFCSPKCKNQYNVNKSRGKKA